jgi:helicase
MQELPIASPTKDSVTNLVLDVVAKGKQAIVFVGTKKSAERAAEDISKSLQPASNGLADKALGVLSKPTKQCERLALCLRKGAAFHHAGLAAAQKDLIEENFRSGQVKVICCTPTLAFGLDLPAYRVIIRDVKRYGQHGMGFIPVLEYLQMAGRAGRPSYDNEGEALLVADNQLEARDLLERYVRGEPEDIFSKLAVEPVLRTYALSLIASRIVHDHEELVEFFSRTFWAHQYKDMDRLAGIINKVVKMLASWGFVDDSGATLLGSRIAQLYVDPLSAHEILEGMETAAAKKQLKPLSLLHLVCNRLEMRPRLRVGAKEANDMQQQLMQESHILLEEEPDIYDPEYDEFIGAYKTAKMLEAWMEESTEEQLLEKYNTAPGELHVKLHTADWLLYSAKELAALAGHKHLLAEI